MNIQIHPQPSVSPLKMNLQIQAEKVHLDNGIQVFLIEAGTEEVMRIDFLFRAGMAREPFPLVSSSVSMMLTEGSEHYSSEEINRILDYYGVFVNSSSERDLSGVVFYFLTNQAEKVIELAGEIILRPAFPEKELDLLLQKRHRWFLVNKEKVQNLAMDQFYESVFGSHHPYGRQVVESDFRSVTSSILKDFHSRNYVPENLVIIVSGRINDKTINLLNRNFGVVRHEALNSGTKLDPIKGSDNKNVHISKPGAIQTAIRIGSATINKTHEDYPGLKIVNTLLGGYFGSRLMKNIREEKGLTYGIHSAVSSLELAGFAVISTEVDTQNKQVTIDEICNEIRRLQSESVGENELEVVRNFMAGELIRMFDGPFALAETFRAVWEFGLDITYYQLLAGKIKSITPDEILSLSVTYYNLDNLYEITVG